MISSLIGQGWADQQSGHDKRLLRVFFEKEIIASQNTLEKENYRDSNFYFKKYEIGLRRCKIADSKLYVKSKPYDLFYFFTNL